MRNFRANRRWHEIEICSPGRVFTDPNTKESWTVSKGAPVAFMGTFHIVREDLANFQRQFFPWTARITGEPIQ